MNDLREAAQQALETLEKSRVFVTAREKIKHPEGTEWYDGTITALRAALAEPVPHGCHVDLEEGMDPDGCVLDEGRPSKCIYARSLVREGKGKTDCEYWQPIEVKR
jgi:hypothetical protein